MRHLVALLLAVCGCQAHPVLQTPTCAQTRLAHHSDLRWWPRADILEISGPNGCVDAWLDACYPRTAVVNAFWKKDDFVAAGWPARPLDGNAWEWGDADGSQLQCQSYGDDVWVFFLARVDLPACPNGESPVPLQPS